MRALHVQQGVKDCPNCDGPMDLSAVGRSMSYKCQKCGYEEKFETI